MKRKKASASANEKHCKAKVEELGNCSSYADLPSDIVTKIMLTLPIESILICKCVCNNWKTVISDSHFAKLHLEHAHVRYMLRIADKYDKLVSRTLYLLPQISEIECKNHLKLKPSFKLPLRNGKSVLENLKYESKRSIRAAASAAKSPYIACNPNYMKFEIVNSCNGLLCLASPSLEGGFKLPIVICNPVTGEFITLPKPPYNKGQKDVRFGFGFQPKTNEYKVMKMWSANANKSISLFIEIYTLGTPTWRNVEVDPEAVKLVLRLDDNWKQLDFLTCLNGALHWIGFSIIMDRKMSILCFNFESERLQSFPSPPHDEFRNIEIRGMGELRGFLYLCCYSFSGATIMWVMNKYGDGESWTKTYSIDTRSKPCEIGIPISLYSLCLPLKHPEEGVAAAMLFCRHEFFFTYYVPERFGFKDFLLVGTHSKGVEVEVIPHIPSLILLKDIVKGDNIEVLNIHSLCAKVKLEEENEVLSLREIKAGMLPT